MSNQSSTRTVRKYEHNIIYYVSRNQQLFGTEIKQVDPVGFFEKEVQGNLLNAEYWVPIFIGKLLERG